MTNSKKTDSYENVMKSIQKNNFTNHFYIDHMGASAINKQKRYKTNDLTIESEYKWEEEKGTTYLYTLITKQGIKGKLFLHSTSSNFKAALHFVKKALKSRSQER